MKEAPTGWACHPLRGRGLDRRHHLRHWRLPQAEEAECSVRAGGSGGLHLCRVLHVAEGRSSSLLFVCTLLVKMTKPEKFLVEGVGKGSIPGCMDFTVIDDVVKVADTQGIGTGRQQFKMIFTGIQSSPQLINSESLLTPLYLVFQ